MSVQSGRMIEPSSRIKAFGKWLTVFVCMSGIIAFFPFGYREIQGNFYAVSEGVVYRSSQLENAALEHRIRQYKIKSILNLRGEHKESHWYQEEVRIARAFGVRHYDYAIPGTREVSDSDIDQILAIVRDAPKPLLIHCKEGADRTGLIAALYLNQIEKVAALKADEQLSILYGHFPYFWSRTSAMDRTFWRYVKTHPWIEREMHRSATQRNICKCEA
jgi:protein tyrosine phosphatase (PTP) superfamily phosphohydrolase (DUF442 family)